MRADAAEFKNVAIFSHYPDWAQDMINLRAQFLNEVVASGNLDQDLSGEQSEEGGDARPELLRSHAHPEVCRGAQRPQDLKTNSLCFTLEAMSTDRLR